MNSDHALYRLARRVSHRIMYRLPITPEDVHDAALAWLMTEARTGPMAEPDLDLLAVLDANPGAGDGTAQTVCDAACRWRDLVGPGGGPNTDTFRRLLADTVDEHREGPRRRRTTTAAGVSIPLMYTATLGFAVYAGRQGWSFWVVVAVTAVAALVNAAIVLAYRR